MSKHRKKRRCNRAFIIALLLFFLVSIAFLIYISITKLNDKTQKENAQNTGNAAAQSEEEIDPRLKFPVMLENDKLELNSAFQYTGANPDNGWEEGENIGAIVLINRSDEYMTEANITLTLSNEEKLDFTVTELPPGKTVWAFEPGNKEYPISEFVTEATGKAKFTKDLGLGAKEITSHGESTSLTLTNTTEKEYSNLTVKCHILFDDAYFGNSIYEYPVESLPANGEVTIDAVDCILGDAEASWIGVSK